MLGKYIINPQYSFCGWEGLPYALIADKERNPIFLNKAQFNVLWNCDGKTDIDVNALEKGTASFFKNFVSKGIVQEAEEGCRLQLHTYRSYECHYRSDVQLSITGRCNYKCRHCFQSAPHGVLGQPTTEQVCAELDQIAACGVQNVSITGGEPLIHEGFWQIVDHLIQLGLNLTTVYSNGRLVNQELLDGFKQRGIHPSWQISFDGLGQHDHIRGVKGAEESAINAIKLLVANGFSVGCAYTLTKRTVPVFRDSVNYLASIGVHSLKSGCTQAQGEWLNATEEWLTDEEYLDFYKKYIPQYLADGRPLNIQFEGLFSGQSEKYLKMSKAMRKKMQEPEDDRQKAVAKGSGSDSSEDDAQAKPYQFMTERNVTEEQSIKFLSCGALATSFYIGPTGRVLPCMSMDGTPVAEAFPTLWETPLQTTLSKGSHFMETTGYTMADVFNHNEECKDCSARCHCGSGCRASAIGANGSDFLALDKRTCLLCKENWAGQIREEINQ